MSPSEWLAFAGMSFVLAMAPGPDNLFVLTQSAVLGARAGLYVVLGLCGGLLVQTIAAALGLAIVIQEFPAVFWAIKIAGAAYLCYLAYMAWTHAEDVPGEGGALGFRKIREIFSEYLACFARALRIFRGRRGEFGRGVAQFRFFEIPGQKLAENGGAKVCFPLFRARSARRGGRKNGGEGTESHCRYARPEAAPGNERGGCVRAGEDSLTAIVREIREELGVDVPASSARLIHSVRRESDFYDVYVFTRRTLPPLKLQREEVADARWVTCAELPDMLRRGELHPLLDYLDELMPYLSGNCQAT